MKAIVAAIHGILTRQTEPSWPDIFDAWMSQRDPTIKVLKKEYLAGPFPRWNCGIKNPLLARGLANEIELIANGMAGVSSGETGVRHPETSISSPPIWLVAHSNGAVIALLVTKRLVAHGYRVGGLILTGAACEADVARNGILGWARSGQLGTAIAYSSAADKVLNGVAAPGERWAFRRWVWGRLIWPYGCLGHTGWLLNHQPLAGTAPELAPSAAATSNTPLAGSPVIFTRWHDGGHSGLFAPENLPATFEQIYQDIVTSSARSDDPARGSEDGAPPQHAGDPYPVSTIAAAVSAPMLCQLAPPPAGAVETWLLSAAAVGSVWLLFKKLGLQKTKESEFVSRADFRNVQLTVEALRDKIDARSLAITDKIERLGDSIHRRLNELDAGLARVDERTRPH